MRLHTYVRQHPTEDDLADSPLAQLQNQIVGLRPPYLVRTDDDRLPIIDVRFETIQPVRTRIFETGQPERSASGKCVSLELFAFLRSVELPTVVGGTLGG